MRYFNLVLLALVMGFGPNILAATASEKRDLCPPPNLTPEKIQLADQKTILVDNSRPIKDLGTDIIVNEFFTTQETLYNFIKLVYKTVEGSLDKYKEKNNLDSKSISFLFKGGNVLRLIANGIFEILPKEASDILREEYSANFKRSDTDFTVYVDEKKLGNLDYDHVLNEVSNLILADLNKIREELKSNPKKYFDFLKLKPDQASKELKKYFQELQELPITKDKENDEWFGAKFKQLQLLDDRAMSHPVCKYYGEYDYRFVNKDDKIVGIPISDKLDWIVNTDNRTLEWPMGRDPKKLVKFNLVRSKVAFEYIYEKDGQINSKPIGGELIDVSVPHRKEARIRDFLDNYDRNIASYTLALGPDDKFSMKAYSMSYLAHDLLSILFGQFDRPWKDPKYEKRINRLFFLALIELMGSYGLGSQAMQDYIKATKEKIIEPLKKLFPLKDNASKRADELKNNAEYIAKTWPEIAAANDFWRELVELITSELIPKVQPDDEEEYKNFIEILDKNINIADKLSKLKFMKIDPSAVYNTDMSKLF